MEDSTVHILNCFYKSAFTKKLVTVAQLPFALAFPPCEHSWRTALDGLTSCEHCGKVYEPWPMEAPLPVPKCDCGAFKTYGTLPFEVGHSSWCTVAAF